MSDKWLHWLTFNLQSSLLHVIINRWGSEVNS